jgi:hypothetical protein
MRGNTRLVAVALLGLAACGGGGGAGEASGGGAGYGGTANVAYGVVHLTASSPETGAVQVPVDVAITLEFDADIAVESFGYPDTWLRAAGSPQDVPVTITRGTSGRVAVTPGQDLAPETDYIFQLSALTADLSGRILDKTTTLEFRTVDQIPPTVTGFDVPNNAAGVTRVGEFTLSFDEAIAASSVSDQTLYLRDIFGARYPCATTVDGHDVVMAPHADLPGDRQFFVVATTSLTDRSGNQLPAVFQSSFTTESDQVSPSVSSAWPAHNADGASPHVQPTFTFDESMDPTSVEAASLLFQDEFSNIISFAIDATLDRRTLRVRPLTTLHERREYTLTFLLGGAAATDVSGNPLTATQSLTFTTGEDATAPSPWTSSPSAGELQVPGVLVAQVRYDEELDGAFVDETSVQLTVDGAAWPAVVELVGADTVQVTPVVALPTDTGCSLVLRGGQDGLRDLAGNVPAADTTIPFTTSSDAEVPDALLLPADGAAAVAVDARLCVVFDAPMDPATVDPSTVLFTDDAGAPLDGDFAVSSLSRVVTFTPAQNLVSGAFYRIRVLGGNGGPRRTTGNWFEADREARFRAGAELDLVPPTVTSSINGIPEARRSGLVLPPSGWTVDVAYSDPLDQWVAAGELEVELTGGDGPSAQALLEVADLGASAARVRIPDAAPLSAGAWTLTVRATDLSGNVGESTVIQFEVDDRSSGAMPFERTQVVWVRTDLDRDNNGVSDFAEDMLRLGLATVGDPSGSNAWLEQLTLQGVLAKASKLFERGPYGEPLDEGSVQLRFTRFQPIAVQHTQIALGGLDPEGDRTRTYGAESTGVLGRAFYDYRNSNISERNTTSTPGTGVFPAEMFLYQAQIHLQVYPSHLTTFASRFQPLCPDMGGTPAGSHPLDAAVLTPSFDYENATSAQRARWNTVMAAVDDWATVIGVILAHEVGHSVGLVAPGAMPTGLFGDSSLHDTFAGAAEVMAPSVGYEAMTTLNYRFRDIDLAYLRQRVLLR